MAKEREDKVKALRLLKLEHLIKTLNYPNTTVLCKELEVSRRTIMRWNFCKTNIMLQLNMIHFIKDIISLIKLSL